MKNYKYFTNVETMEDLKKEYKQNILKFHPDRGGNASDFVAMKEEYDTLFKELQLSTTKKEEKTETPEKFKDLMEKLISLGVEFNIDILGSWVWVYGSNTYGIREQLKTLGFFWSAGKKKWAWNQGEKKSSGHYKKKKYSDLQAKYGCDSYKTENNPQKLLN